MADFRAIAAVGRSLERLLNATFADPDPPVPGKTTHAALVTSKAFDPGAGGGFDVGAAGLSIFLYRIVPNTAMRAAWSGVGHVDGRAHLPVDLHYLLTAWADNADWEHAILGKAMQCLEDTPILGGPLLTPSAAWAPTEAIQVTLDLVEIETLLRIFDSFESEYRLSVPYLARVVRIDGAAAYPSPPATTVITGKVPEAVA